MTESGTDAGVVIVNGLSPAIKGWNWKTCSFASLKSPSRFQSTHASRRPMSDEVTVIGVAKPLAKTLLNVTPSSSSS